jgi:hypothetical protein
MIEPLHRETQPSSLAVKNMISRKDHTHNLQHGSYDVQSWLLEFGYRYSGYEDWPRFLRCNVIY